jgi:hypothetical protein
VPTIDLPADELAAVTAAIRGVLEGRRFPHAPRLVPLRAALARFEAGARTDLEPSRDAPTRLTHKAAPPKANQNIEGAAVTRRDAAKQRRGP